MEKIRDYLDRFKIRFFEHFPEEMQCPICGKGGDDYCLLIGIDGTAERNIEKAKPVHLHCLLLASELRLNTEVGFLYRRINTSKETET